LILPRAQRGRFALNEIAREAKAREIALGHEPDATPIVLMIKKRKAAAQSSGIRGTVAAELTIVARSST